MPATWKGGKMECRRKRIINGHLVEEFWWNDLRAVYVDNLRTDDIYEVACRKVEKCPDEQYENLVDARWEAPDAQDEKG
jgi:hypothetical protein